MSRALNGSTQYLRASAPTVSGYPLTLACWARPANTNADKIAMWVGDRTNDANSIGLAMWDTALVGFTRKDAGFRDSFSASSYVANTWQHIGGVAASNTSGFTYLNGVPGTESTEADTVSFAGFNGLTVGLYDRLSPFGFFNGQIAHPAVWNVALTAVEMLMLAAGLSPLRVRPQSLIFYAPTLGRDTVDIEIIGTRAFAITGSAAASVEEPPVVAGNRSSKIFLPTVSNIINTVMLDDSLLVSDVTLTSALRNMLQLDAMVLNDVFLSSASRYAFISEALTLADAFLRRVNLTRVIDDSLITIDDFLASTTNVRIVTAVLTDFMLLADAFNSQMWLTRDSAEVLVISDSTAGSTSRLADLADSFQLYDDATQQFNLRRRLTDHVNLYDDLVALLTTLIVGDGSRIRIGSDKSTIQLGISLPRIKLGGGGV